MTCWKLATVVRVSRKGKGEAGVQGAKLDEQQVGTLEAKKVYRLGTKLVSLCVYQSGK